MPLKKNQEQTFDRNEPCDILGNSQTERQINKQRQTDGLTEGRESLQENNSLIHEDDIYKKFF